MTLKEFDKLYNVGKCKDCGDSDVIRNRKGYCQYCSDKENEVI